MKEQDQMNSAGGKRRKRLLLSTLCIVALLEFIAAAFFLVSYPSDHPTRFFSFNSVLSRLLEHKDPFIFNGVMIEEQRTVAIINDQIAARGTVVNGVQILNISSTNLTVEYDEELHTLSIGERL